MKKIINGRLYNTETAEYIGYDEYGNVGDCHWWCESLFKKRTGEFYLFCEGGAFSQYGKQLRYNEWSEGRDIMPLSIAAAKEWAEDHLSYEKYVRCFGEVEE